MKFTHLLAATCVLAASGPAFAADLAVRKAVPPVAVAPAPYSWTGFYVGLNAGYAWSNNSTSYNKHQQHSAFPPTFYSGAPRACSIFRLIRSESS